MIVFIPVTDLVIVMQINYYVTTWRDRLRGSRVHPSS